jgi:hypothetical protein
VRRGVLERCAAPLPSFERLALARSPALSGALPRPPTPNKSVRSVRKPRVLSLIAGPATIGGAVQPSASPRRQAMPGDTSNAIHDQH